MKYLAAIVLILLALWLVYALRTAKKHGNSCTGSCDGCTGCKKNPK